MAIREIQSKEIASNHQEGMRYAFRRNSDGMYHCCTGEGDVWVKDINDPRVFGIYRNWSAVSVSRFLDSHKIAHTILVKDAA